MATFYNVDKILLPQLDIRHFRARKISVRKVERRHRNIVPFLCLEITAAVQNFWATFFHDTSCVSIVSKNWLGYILGDFLSSSSGHTEPTRRVARANPCLLEFKKVHIVIFEIWTKSGVFDSKL
jgi:hypothetical protein